MRNKFSIITVTYNSGKTLEQTIRSVIEKKDIDVEYIIIDGGSSDNTLDIVKKYETYIYYWCSAPDNGIYDAMNKGIKKSTGNIIGIINSDDWYTPNALKQVDEIFSKREDVDILHGNIKRVELNGATTILQPDIKKNYREEMTYFHPTFFVKKKVYNDIGCFDCKYKISADFEFFYRAKECKKNFYYLDSVLVNMRNGGISVQRAEAAIDENELIQNKYRCSLLFRKTIKLKRKSRLFLSKTIIGKIVRWFKYYKR